MPTSVPGSKPMLCLACPAQARPGARAVARGFTLLELLVVLSIIALSVGVASLALRDGSQTQLEHEGTRLAALLEMARAEARVTGVMVRWVPAAPGDEAAFRFVGLPPGQSMPKAWLDARVSAQVLGQTHLVLGPDAILPAQRVLLRLLDQRLEVASDGLGPFNVVPPAALALGQARP